MKAFAAKYIFNGKKLLEDHVVVIENGLVKDVTDKSSFLGIVKYIGDGVITPGFIDLQLNGCGGVLFNEQISTDTLEIMRNTWLKFGTTAFLPTLITSDFKDVISALNVTKEWFDKFGNSNGVLGIHLEGPFISEIKSGIHPKNFIIKPTNELLEQIVSYRKYFLIKMTIAVEKFSLEQIEYLIDNGIILSIGHSNADYKTAETAIKVGVTTSTHMFNAMSGLTGRKPGVIGAILNTDIYVGVIVDMLHVDAANIRLLQKVKDGRAYLVTDAVTPAGTDITEFEFAGKLLYVKNGKCVDQDGVLGGACLTMNQGVQNCLEECGLTLEESLAMATTIPAQVVGMDKFIGKIKKGYRADLVYMDLESFECEVL